MKREVDRRAIPRSGGKCSLLTVENIFGLPAHGN